MKNGFMTVAAAVPSVKVADVDYNVAGIERLMKDADKAGVEVVVFPELSVTGYSCQDLFFQQSLLEGAERGLTELMKATADLDVIAIVGVPFTIDAAIFNGAAVIQHGALLGMVVKTYLPNYGEFYEKRWFSSAADLNDTALTYAGHYVTVGTQPQCFLTADGVAFGIEICEDLWSPVSPGRISALAGNEVVFNLSADNELIGKYGYLRSLVAQQSVMSLCGYVYCGCGFGESSQDVVFGGKALVYECGEQVAEGSRFSFAPQLTVACIDIDRIRGERRRNTTFTQAKRGIASLRIACDEPLHPVRDTDLSETRIIHPHPFMPAGMTVEEVCNEVINIQAAGLAKRLVHTNCRKVVVGVSGGLDSTLALLVCVYTFDRLGYDRRDILGITMPGFGTSDRTYDNAVTLMQAMGITMREISIAAAVTQHFSDIGHDIDNHDVTYENAQARERTQILMDVANREGGMVIGTGDLSELALGWATYNGDHMSMYGINASVPKTMIPHIVNHFADLFETKGEKAGNGKALSGTIRHTLRDIIDTPISPELVPADPQGNITQKTEDLVGPYELHDFFLYYMLRYGYRPQKIFILARAAFKDRYTDEVIKKWLTTFVRRFFAQQFKRSCLPDGPKVGSVSLSPRGDWRMPTDASATLWLDELKSL